MPPRGGILRRVGITITPEQVRAAFWSAFRELDNDPSLHPMDIPCFDEAHGEGGMIDGRLPPVYYEHLSFYLNVLTGDNHD